MEIELAESALESRVKIVLSEKELEELVDKYFLSGTVFIAPEFSKVFTIVVK